MDAHPAVSFASTGVSPVDQSNFKVMGDLTLRGVTLPVTFDVEVSGNSKDPYGNIRLGLEGSTTINRKDWGLNWNAPLETGGVVISEKITLEFEISAIKNVE